MFGSFFFFFTILRNSLRRENVKKGYEKIDVEMQTSSVVVVNTQKNEELHHC